MVGRSNERQAPQSSHRVIARGLHAGAIPSAHQSPVTGRDGGVPASGRVAGAVGQDSGWERSANSTCIAQSLPAVM